ncbi:MAG: hypothetical protein ACI9OU_001164 [Candidatus Promineifilaceae bacterium]
MSIFLTSVSSANSAVNLFFSGLKFCNAALAHGLLNVKK